MDDVKSKNSDRTIELPGWLVSQMLALPRVSGCDLIFQTSVGTALNSGNVLTRELKPVCAKLGIEIGGWHDFRHTLSNALRKAGKHPKVIADILGHAKVNLAMDVYDQTSLAERSDALASVTPLLPSCDQNEEKPSIQ